MKLLTVVQERLSPELVAPQISLLILVWHKSAWVIPLQLILITIIASYFFSFEFRLRVSLAAGGNLALISRIRNINCKPFSFSIAYHTYFAISDIRYSSCHINVDNRLIGILIY